MAPHAWSINLTDLVKVTNTWGDGEAETLLVWARWAAESVCYVLDLDDIQHRVSPAIGGYTPDILDVHHVRWASVSAITALDLCAAVLGRRYCSRAGPRREFTLRYFKASGSTGKAVTEAAQRLGQLPKDAQDWVRDVLADPEYRIVLDARNPFTHASLSRLIFAGASIGAGGRSQTEPRTKFRIGQPQQEVDARDLLETARRVAVGHVEWFHAGVMARQF